MAEQVVFWVAAVIGVGAGIAVVSLRNVVHAALMLVINLLAIAVLFLALQSPFLGVVQVIVYAGAIMVLFLFVIMLLGVGRDDPLIETRLPHRLGAVLAGTLIAGAALFAFSGGLSAASRCAPPGGDAPATAGGFDCRGLTGPLAAADNSSVQLLADRLFGRYTLPLEAAALLLTVATIGAIVLGSRREGEEEGPGEPRGGAGRAMEGEEEDPLASPGGGFSESRSEAGRAMEGEDQ